MLPWFRPAMSIMYPSSCSTSHRLTGHYVCHASRLVKLFLEGVLLLPPLVVLIARESRRANDRSQHFEVREASGHQRDQPGRSAIAAAQIQVNGFDSVARRVVYSSARLACDWQRESRMSRQYELEEQASAHEKSLCLLAPP